MSKELQTGMLSDIKTERIWRGCIHQLFEAQAKQTPDAIAVIFREDQYTYRQVNDLANQVARRLQRSGVGPEVQVGLCVERSLEAVIGILGILKAGGAYVPLDPAYPKDRLSFMLEDAQIPLLLTQQKLLSQLPLHQIRTLCLDTDLESFMNEEEEERTSGVRPDNTVYVIYTSGSTGQPKGIVVTHQGIVNNIVDLNSRFSVGSGDSILLLSSLSFDMSVYEILGTLAAGGTVVIPLPEMERDPAHWVKLMLQHRITLWNSVPSLLEMLVQYLTNHPDIPPLFLRLALLGGDWIPVDLPDRLKTFAKNIQVISLGGATEASIHSILFPIERCDPSWRSIPYGWPMANQQAYILDTQQQPVPVGVPGELYLGGIGLARGYFKRPALTAEKFIPHPFSQIPGERLYKTGDLARYRSDGIIELLGRIDYQVKIRGIRIELGEITAALRQHPAIEDAVVQTWTDQVGDKQLVAYILSRERQLLSASELRAFLKQLLPEYMLPTSFVQLEAFPLSPNGKVDRRALLPPETQRSVLRAAFIAPRTPVEQILAAIWAEMFNLEQIGIHDNFFELGGHSLLALRILAYVQEIFQMELPLSIIFKAPTVAELAEHLETMSRRAHQDINGFARTFLSFDQLPEDGMNTPLPERVDDPFETGR